MGLLHPHPLARGGLELPVGTSQTRGGSSRYQSHIRGEEQKLQEQEGGDQTAECAGQWDGLAAKHLGDEQRGDRREENQGGGGESLVHTTTLVEEPEGERPGVILNPDRREDGDCVEKECSAHQEGHSIAPLDHSETRTTVASRPEGSRIFTRPQARWEA